MIQNEYMAAKSQPTTTTYHYFTCNNNSKIFANFSRIFNQNQKFSTAKAHLSKLSTFQGMFSFSNTFQEPTDEPCSKDLNDYQTTEWDEWALLTMKISNSSKHLNGDSIASHRAIMKDTVENDRSPPDNDRVSFVTFLVPWSTFTW